MSEYKNNFIYNVNFNSGDLSNQLVKLLLFTNNYFKYNDEYIKEKYNIDTYEDFRNYFKKNYKQKLIFNCLKSEKLFINFINLDYNYFDYKYSGVQTQTIMDFFITGKLFYFNKCNEKNIKYKDKNHLQECNCKIKVKTISNLSIETLIFILKEFASNFNKNYKDNTSKNSNNTFQTLKSNNSINSNKSLIKIPKNDISKQLVNCIDKLEKAESNLGINCQIDKQYILNSVSDNELVNELFDKYSLNKNTFKLQSTNDKYEQNRFNHIKNNNKKFYFKYSDDSSKSDINIIKQSNQHNNDLKSNTSTNKSIFVSQLDSDFVDLNSDYSVIDFKKQLSIKNSKEIQKQQFKTDLSFINEKQETNFINLSDDKYSSDKNITITQMIAQNIYNCSEHSDEKIKINNDDFDNQTQMYISDKSIEHSDEKININNDDFDNQTQMYISDKSTELSSDLNKIENMNGLDVTSIHEEIESELSNNEIKQFDLLKSIKMIIEYLDVSNNILMDNSDNMVKLALEIKNNLKINFSEELANKFDRIFQKSMMIKIISDTDDMKSYYLLHKELIDIKNLVIINMVN